MNELTETHPGSWILVAGPRTIRKTMSTFVARLAERGPVRVLDCGNQFNAYYVARQVRGHFDVLQRISVSRAFTCYQVVATLEKATCGQAPFIMLDLLSTFYDENVNFAERRRLLERCISQITRLSTQSGGAISIHPPAIVSLEAEQLFAILSDAAPELWSQELPAPIFQPWRLF